MTNPKCRSNSLQAKSVSTHLTSTENKLERNNENSIRLYNQNKKKYEKYPRTSLLHITSMESSIVIENSDLHET